MKRCIVLAILVLPMGTGCIGYVYPGLSYLPELTVDTEKNGSVHAFRVDMDRTERDSQLTLSQYTLARVPVNARGQIPSQLEVAPVTGVYNPLGLGTPAGHERNEYSMAIRLYRPRFCTQEIKAWEKAHEVVWAPAPNLVAQEKAIDDLLAPPVAAGERKGTWWEQKDEKSVGLGMQPGLVSRMHREALVFAATEYQHLADSREASEPNMQAVRDRLRNKTQWLKGFADRLPDAK